MKQVLKRLSLLALSLALVMAAALPCWAADTAAAPTDAPAETEEMAEMPGDGAAPEGESMPEMGPRKSSWQKAMRSTWAFTWRRRP